MKIEEITNEVADKLQVSSPEPQNGSSEAPPPAADAAQVGPSPQQPSEKRTVDEVWADLNKSPFFMTELEENDDTEALRALAYEGTPLENGTDFKERGNECFKEKKWKDAKEFYGKGILILAAEERKRKANAEAGKDPVVSPPPPPAETPQETEEPSPEEIKQQRAVLETLYVNRAACHLELKNHRSCWLDCAAALRLNPRNIKAWYRSARGLLAVDRIEEADEACARGLAIDASNAALQALARDIIKRHETVTARRRKEEERLATEKRRALLLKAALRARGIRTRSTAQPPEMEDAAVRLVPDPDDARSSLSFPTVLLYPADLETDFIKVFGETESLADHLGYVFPLPWDRRGEYTLAGVECYMDTIKGGLIKVGKKMSLLKVLSSGSVEVVDDVVRIFVLPKAKAAGWVEEYKSKKAAENKGG